MSSCFDNGHPRFRTSKPRVEQSHFRGQVEGDGTIVKDLFCSVCHDLPLPRLDARLFSWAPFG